MRYIKVWIHLVWSTKNREPLLTSEIRFKVLEHILQNGRSKGIFIDFVNGYTDHVHCLVSLGAEQSLSKIMHLIKGESSSGLTKIILVLPSLNANRIFCCLSKRIKH